MIKISAVIITLNEEKHIGRCIDSVTRVADEVLIVDSFSSDHTEKIVLNKGAKFIQNKFEGYGKQKHFACSSAENRYILSLDADETLDDEAVKSINAIKKNWTHPLYSIKRMTQYSGKWIKHSGWYPDRKIRLFDRESTNWDLADLHEKVIVKNKNDVGTVNGNILHFTYESISHHVDQVNNYSSKAALGLAKKGKNALIAHMIINPLFHFVKDYFFKLGFLDGVEGWMVCASSAHSRFLKYSKAYEFKKKSNLKN